MEQNPHLHDVGSKCHCALRQAQEELREVIVARTQGLLRRLPFLINDSLVASAPLFVRSFVSRF